VTSIAWSPDELRLASASRDKTVKIWDAVTGQCESTLHVSSPRFLQFDQVNLNHLHTTFGTFKISSSLQTPYGYGLNDDYSWVTYSGENLLWIPPEYRPTKPSLAEFSLANSVMTLAIGCLSGRVVFIALPEQGPMYDHRL